MRIIDMGDVGFMEVLGRLKAFRFLRGYSAIREETRSNLESCCKPSPGSSHSRL
jgi:hypothetical protein